MNRMILQIVIVPNIITLENTAIQKDKELTPYRNQHFEHCSGAL